MDLNSRIDARVVTNVCGRTYERAENRISLSRMPEAGATKKEFSRVNSIFFIFIYSLKYEYLIELLDF